MFSFTNKSDFLSDSRLTSLTCRLLSKVVNLDSLIVRFVSLWIFRFTYFISRVRSDEQTRVFGETNRNKRSTCQQLIGQYFCSSYITAWLLRSHDILLYVCFSLSLVVSRPVRYWKWSDVRRFRSEISAHASTGAIGPHAFPTVSRFNTS